MLTVVCCIIGSCQCSTALHQLAQSREHLAALDKSCSEQSLELRKKLGVRSVPAVPNKLCLPDMHAPEDVITATVEGR